MDICKICKGKCCKAETSHLSLTKNELKLIEEETQTKYKVRKAYLKNLYIISNKKKCLFLTPKGCKLKNKPLGCRLFPFRPTQQGMVIRTKCPYWDKLTKNNLTKAIKDYEKNKNEWKQTW